NPSHTPTSTAGTAITQESDEARVTGRRIVLTAGTGIGSGTPIATDVSDGAGASLEAVTDSGVGRIKEIDGDLPVDEITSTHDIFGSGGAVSVDARGAILAADGYTGLVEGGAISLEAETGGIGTAAHYLQIDAGVFAADKLNVEAHDHTYLEEPHGNLLINCIGSSGDVHV